MAQPSGRRESSLDQYLREISAHPLLTRAQEAELGRRIREGDQDALDALVRSNLRFVVSVAKKYQNRGVPLCDLVSEGNLGLIRAARTFDERRGVKFISYAVWWVRQGITRAVAEHGRAVRLPTRRAGLLHRIAACSASLRQELGHEPSVAETAEALELPADEVRTTLAVGRTSVSFDAPLAHGADTRLADCVPDTRSPAPDHGAYLRAVSAAVDEALGGLEEREATVLRLYYGFDGQRSMTLAEIGGLLELTRERVRQIKEKALLRLRHLSCARKLESFSGD